MYGSEAQIIEKQKKATLRKMRSRLVSTAQLDLELKQKQMIKTRVDRFGKGLQILSVFGSLLVAAISIQYKDQIASQLGVAGLAQIKDPKDQLSNDDKARYWAYALFQKEEFIKKFGDQGMIINAMQGFSELKRLMPIISPSARMEITKYIPPGGIQ